MLVRKSKITNGRVIIELLVKKFLQNFRLMPDKKLKKLRRKIKKKEINFKTSKSFSTPKRLVFFIKGIPEKIEQKKKVIKGPKVDAPELALDGFIKSNNLNKSDIYKKKIEKGEFYFAETKPKGN